jgi:excisionase family DNA binding protein
MARRPLYVRLPVAEAQRLDRAAFELGATKQDLVSSLISRHLGDEVGHHSFVPHEVLDLEGAADLLRLDVDRVAELAESGELPGRRVDDEWRFSREALLKWLEG